MMCTNEQLRAAYALNLCTVSVAQIIDYNDMGILMQEYDNILNNLNMEAFPKDNALREALVQILDTIKLCKISEGDRELIDSEYQSRMKNAVWSAVPHLGLIFATGNPIAIAMNLATQVGIGYMNYRRNRVEYQQGQEKEYWQIQKSKLDMFSNLQQMLFETAWRLADTFNFPDEYRLTDQQVHKYNNTLLEDNPIKRYNSLDFMKDKFKAYPHFWYQMGSTANSIYRSDNLGIDDSTRASYKEKAIESFEHYRKLNKFNLLRHDAITSAWALEYIDLLDLSDENDRAKAKELLGEAEAHAGEANDVLELCAYADLKLGCYDDAVRLFKALVNQNYNAEVNARILSALLIYNSRDPEKRDNALFEYAQLPLITEQEYLLPLPSTEEEWKNFKPDWGKNEVGADTANDSVAAPNAPARSDNTPAITENAKISTRDAEESVDRVMGWIAGHQGFDRVAAYETEDYFVIRFLKGKKAVYAAGEGENFPETIRIDKITGAIAIDSFVDNSALSNTAALSWGKQERLFCKENNLYAFDAGGVKSFNVNTLTGFDVVAGAECLDGGSSKRDAADIALHMYRCLTTSNDSISGCGNHLAFIYNGTLYRYDLKEQCCKKLCKTSANSIFATTHGIYLLMRNEPSSRIEFYDYAECRIVKDFSVDSVDAIYYVHDDCDFYFKKGSSVELLHMSADGKTTITTFGGSAQSIVYVYDDCVLYAMNGLLNMIPYVTGKKVTLASGVVCRKSTDVGVIRHKVQYEMMPVGFVRVGKWIYYYEDGRRDLPQKVNIDKPNSEKAVPSYRTLEDAERI